MALIDALIDKMEGKYGTPAMKPAEITLSRKEVWALKAEYEDLRRVTESSEGCGFALVTKAGEPNAAESLIQSFNRMRDWMQANVPEMECRGDEDCDHCLGLQILQSAM